MDFLAPTLDEVRTALNFIDPCSDRAQWAEIAMSLKSEFGDDAFSVFDDWSQDSDQYKSADCRATYKSVSAAGGVTISTLFRRAIDAGFQPSSKELSAEQKHAREVEHKRRAAENKKREAAELAHQNKWREVVAEASTAIWDLCGDEGASEYLKRKQVFAYGLRFPRYAFVLELLEYEYSFKVHKTASGVSAFYKNKTDETKFRHIKPGVVLVPMLDETDAMHNIQLVFKQNKSFLPGRKSGLFHMLNLPHAADVPIIIAEGYATAASCLRATGWGAVMAFDSGNLPAVAKKIRSLYPLNRIVIAADDDFKNKDNPGVKKAKEAAIVCGGRVALPNFESGAAA